VYRFLDHPILGLSPGDQILIWSMRGWVTAMAAQRCPCRALGASFESWRLADILPDFNMMMFLLNNEGLRRHRFCHQQCPQVGDDEAALLALFHAAAGHEEKLVRRLTEQLVKAEAAPPFLAAVAQAADVLRRTPVPRAS
jgi:hypothetical protein